MRSLFFMAIFPLQALCADTTTKQPESFRNYQQDDSISEFYRQQHEQQTVEFVTAMREQLHAPMRETISKSVWRMLKKLNELVDESDPDTSLPNSVHAMQTAEAIRADVDNLAKELDIRAHDLDWMILVGLIHDMGKAFALYTEFAQWAVVGDTFPVGCAYAPENIYYDFFKSNPDFNDPRYNTKLGMYEANAGLENLIMSFGHDEYMYFVAAEESNLPPEALSIIRYHSCYPIHKYNAYQHLLSAHDEHHLKFVRAFNKYDLYSKSAAVPDMKALKPYYKALINKYFPPEPGQKEKIISWPKLKKPTT